jgi:hypothetical protein
LGCLLGCGGISNGVGTTPPTPTTPGLAVADSGNNRILFYNTPSSTNEGASVVLGQADFTHGSVNQSGAEPAANSLNGPAGLAKDSSGNLYVADTGNCRVLEFKTPFTNGMNASLVIGQLGFTTASCQSTASGLGEPSGETLDNQGNLWVVDEGGSRVLEYVRPFSNGMAATVAIGQTSTSSSAGCNQGTNSLAITTASMLCNPAAAAFDSKGNLWVVDGNGRVLEFAPPFSTGMAASLEIGQPAATAFTSTDYGYSDTTASSLYAPKSLAFDASGDLWIMDFETNRVLEFVLPFSNGMTATTVLGQMNFTSSLQNQNPGGGLAGPAANTLFSPGGLTFDGSGNLNVADTGNQRVLVFAPPFSNGMNAASVLGQTNFTLQSANEDASSPAANTLRGPSAVLTF